MGKHVLYISSFNKELVKNISDDIRNLARKTGESLWGIPLDTGISEGNILYMDSSVMGSLPIMASSLRAPLIEYVFFDFENGREIYLISMLLSREYKDGEVIFKMRENTMDLLIKRCRKLDREKECRDFKIVDENPFFRTRLYAERKSLVKGSIENGFCEECTAEEILSNVGVSDVYIADPFMKDKVLSNLEKTLGIRAAAVHIISDRVDIYSPITSVDSLVFKGDKKSVKEALCALMLDFSDNGKEKSIKKLKALLNESADLEKTKRVAREDGPFNKNGK